MNVQDTVRTVVIPRQAEPSDDLPAATSVAARPVPAPAAAPLLGRDRPLTTDEREFLYGFGALVLLLSTFIVTFLLLSHYAWS